LQYFFLFGLRTKTAEHFNPHRVLAHALPEHFEMLLSENSGWREHGNLLPLHDRLECGAHCDFRFAETNVAANQPIHRPGPFHVDLRVDDRLHLVRRFPERE
jgi:hypothetical protein